MSLGAQRHAGALENHVQRQIEHSRMFFWHRVRWSAVAGYLPEDRDFTLVDVGAGAGLLGAFMARDRPRGRNMFVETLPALERHLESEYGLASNAGRGDSYATAEFVALLDVLEHQRDDRAFLGDLVSRMRPGALLMIMVPAHMRLWSRWDVNLGHHRRYDRSVLRGATADLPVRVIEMSYLFPEMLPLGVVRRLRRPAGSGSDEAAFPDLSRGVNDALFAVGTATLRLRRWWPAGTSLFAVLERN